jgi:hypothetical protein
MCFNELLDYLYHFFDLRISRRLFVNLFLRHLRQSSYIIYLHYSFSSKNEWYLAGFILDTQTNDEAGV